ncbi:MAG TPA: PKD domain-containing protein [Solirubrobacteraceae bacterium]|nr:PKD domain-containing protein [Solirubrobacteraceae bacterium]
MSVAEVAAAEGVACDHVTKLSVSTPLDPTPHVIEGHEAICGEELGGGALAVPFFETVGGSNEPPIWFVWPPLTPNELISKHVVQGAGDGPLFADFEIEGGLLVVEPPSFSPSQPEAEMPVSFSEPEVRPSMGHSDLQFTWNFADGETASEPSPTHIFDPPHGSGKHTYHVTVTATARAPQGPVSGAVTVPVEVTENEKTPRRESPEPPGNAHSNLSEGLPSGPVNAPSNGVLPSRRFRPSPHGGSNGRGTGRNRGNGSGRRAGAGTGSDSGSGSGSGPAGGNGEGNAAATGTGSTPSPADSAPGQRAPSTARPSPIVSGLVGVLLESDLRELPAGVYRSVDQSPSGNPSLPDAGHGSAGERAVGVLPWIGGGLAALALLLLGGLSEFQPRARNRRLSPR